MRDYELETIKRVDFIKKTLKESGLEGIVYGNSGGKDSCLTGILCKKACDNTLGIIMPAGSKRNFTEDKRDALLVADRYNIETKVIDLSTALEEMIDVIFAGKTLSNSAITNIAPRLRMTALYSIAANEKRLVAGTGNRSEYYMGYFTKWGDGAADFNPIADLTVREIYEFLNFLDAPREIIDKAPSAGLFEGQTDEKEMGVSYKAIDDFLLNGETDEESLKRIIYLHNISEHKRKAIKKPST